MPHDELKPKDRVVLRMTRDGAVEENLTEGTSEKVSKRLEDAQLVAPHDAETGDLTEEVRKRRQLRPDELEDAVSQAQAETQSAEQETAADTLTVVLPDRTLMGHSSYPIVLAKGSQV